jgi:multiple sugar transport system substrate-binding protein
MAKATLTVWLIQEHEKVMREKMIPEFKREHPDIEVLLTTTTWEYLWDKVVRYGQRKQGPDVFQIGNTLNGLLAQRGTIRDITAMVNQVGGLTAFVKPVGSLCVYPGTDKIYSVPWYLDVRILCYRDNILNALTIDEDDLRTINGLVKACKKVHNYRVNNKAVPAFGIFGKRDAMLLHNLAPWIWNYGGDFLSVDAKGVRFNEDAALQGIKTYFNLVNTYCPHGTVLQSPDELAGNFLVHGDYCFANFPPTVYRKYLDPESPAASQMSANISCASTPGGPGGRHAFLGGSNLAISSFSHHADEAWTFISFLLRQDMQEKFNQETRQPPSLLKCYTPTFLGNSTFNKALKESVKAGRCFPNTDKWALLEDILVEMIHNVLVSIKEETYNENLLAGMINEAAEKARTVIK